MKMIIKLRLVDIGRFWKILLDWLIPSNLKMIINFSLKLKMIYKLGYGMGIVV